MDPRSGYHSGGQPGLEVVNQPDLEVAGQEHLRYGQPLPEARGGESMYSGMETTLPKYSGHPGHYVSAASDPSYAPLPPGELESPQKGGRKRLLWIVGAAIAVVVILAAVLGGVLGSRAANSSSGDEAAPSQTGGGGSGGGSGNSGQNQPGDTASNTTTPPQLIRPGSGLSVTGWRKPDGDVEAYLFYQDPQDGLRYSKCDTGRRTSTNDSACWESPVSFNSFANAGTHLTATTLLYGDEYQPQIQLFYAGYKTRLLGININEGEKPSVREDTVNHLNIYTILDSSMTAYWPWTIYQDSTGALHHVRNQLDGRFGPQEEKWDNNKLNTTALTASRLAIVPMVPDFSRIAVKGGYAVFYQDSDEKLAVAVTDLDSPELAKDYVLSWPTTTLPSITLPKRAPIAAFSVARPSDLLKTVDTFVLYLDANADINVLYADGYSTKWKTAQPDALKGADADTDITCLTMATSNYNAAKTTVPLEPPSSDVRCFFQRGGQVIEVKLQDAKTAKWVVVGSVPIP
ncbi:hypothetical protein C8A00DRAFT_32281 [Chaetomidium leptoderma]|uniref:Fucose-specific lectin n=1 Tax=Chaetomidium leptoderma TaxID=669021 RepID=A0AAN6VNL9_9PEZI|nr:hypothetical protein C8A00DRAFT_32281 [Chaetomidium leptoderma]